MESFVISYDGKVPRQMAEKYGRELTLKERFKHKIFGIGFFKPIERQSNILSEWFRIKNFSVRPHLDQLTKGLIFRLKGTNEMDALAIQYTEINKISINRIPDEITPIPLSPFWMLIKLGFEPRKVRWLAFSWRYEFKFGAIEVIIEIDENEPIRLIWNARHEPAVKTFFSSKYLSEKKVGSTNIITK
ncbi:MAG: hypothetical protein AAF693_21985 [Bacteroidota bacterium]